LYLKCYWYHTIRPTSGLCYEGLAPNLFAKRSGQPGFTYSCKDFLTPSQFVDKLAPQNRLTDTSGQTILVDPFWFRLICTLHESGYLYKMSEYMERLGSTPLSNVFQAALPLQLLVKMCKLSLTSLM
jgi:hypothetical protein